MKKAFLIPLLFLILIVQFPYVSADSGLNNLFVDNFKIWDSLLTRYIDLNGTVVEHYDKSFTESKGTTLSGVGFYILPLIKWYNVTGNEYYLKKAQLIIDCFISDSFFRVSTPQGEAIYIPQWYHDGSERDATCKITAISGIVSLKLYEILGEQKYLDYAKNISFQSRNWFVVIDNSTDLAWTPGYYVTTADPKVGVNRQGALGYLYAVYSKYNSSYADDVPKIFNWIWRAQKPSGGLAYDINMSLPETLPYTAFSVWFAVKSYQYVPSKFNDDLKSKINQTISWILAQNPNSGYLTMQICAAALGEAYKSGIYSFNSTELHKIRSLIYSSFKTIKFGLKGVSDIKDTYTNGFRWSQYFLGCLFDLYPLPSELNQGDYELYWDENENREENPEAFWLDDYQEAIYGTEKISFLLHNDPDHVYIQVADYNHAYDKLSIKVYGETGKISILKFYSEQPVAVKVNGDSVESGTYWSYNATSKILTLTYTHSSLAEYEIYFSSTGALNEQLVYLTVILALLMICLNVFKWMMGER